MTMTRTRLGSCREINGEVRQVVEVTQSVEEEEEEVVVVVVVVVEVVVVHRGWEGRGGLVFWGTAWRGRTQARRLRFRSHPEVRRAPILRHPHPPV